jgi:phytoene dehydrogenase-like protein
MENFDAIVIGSGMGALTTACLLAHRGQRVAVLEQNWLPGGCTSSYWRKGFVFESGATTLVGLDPDMPLRYLLDRLQIDLPAVPLAVPMQVHMANGPTLTRYQPLDQWIAEAERVFGPQGQADFWRFCYRVSQFVWGTSLRQTVFPPTRLADLWACARRVTWPQLRYAPYAFFSTEWLLKKYKLLDNQPFVDFVNEQLLITAQNHAPEVNVLFGTTALCYTNYGNYYVNGGLINLVKPLVNYLEACGSTVCLRHRVEAVQRHGTGYQVRCSVKGQAERWFQGRFVVSGIPINNTLPLFAETPSQPMANGLSARLARKVLGSPQLNSAFQMGIGFQTTQAFSCLHHQIHLPEPLPHIGSASVFVSLSHPADASRTDAPGQAVASVSTHVRHPAAHLHLPKPDIERAILAQLVAKGFFQPEQVVYTHSSAPGAWQKWTQREHGFVGGYPQYLHIKPWQMLDARLDGHGAYLCGDTAYPGQGIPGATLSGIIAFEKLCRDHGLSLK